MRLILLIGLALLSENLFSQALEFGSLKVWTSKNFLEAGHLLRVDIEGKDAEIKLNSAEASFLNQKILFFRSTKRLSALIGVPFRIVAMPYDIHIKVDTNLGSKELTLPFQPVGIPRPPPPDLSKPRYIPALENSEVIKVSSDRALPNFNLEKRIESENKEMAKAYAVVTQEKKWTDPFRAPLSSKITSGFGSLRVMNHQATSFHFGVDFRAPVGTPVQVAADGQVATTRDLFQLGKTVLVDHGYGVFTSYSHLSRFSVKPGDRVKAKSILGFSGRSGRVSGPHLHWGAIVNGVRVDPLDLILLTQSDSAKNPGAQALSPNSKSSSQ